MKKNKNGTSIGFATQDKHVELLCDSREINGFLNRHSKDDWGEIDVKQKKKNTVAQESGKGIVVSVYPIDLERRFKIHEVRVETDVQKNRTHLAIIYSKEP